MESNQMTCPQCGLANNPLAEACAQCGLIFVKNNGMHVQAEQDEQKRKAIEEAEAILEQSDPANVKETTNRTDASEDTIEMPIPVENQTSNTPSDAPFTDNTQPKENQKPLTAEIELEAIETSIEMVTTDAEELFLSEVESSRLSELQKPVQTEPPVDSATAPETATEQNDKMETPDDVGDEMKDENKDDMALKPAEDAEEKATQPEEDPAKNKPAESRSEVAEPEKAGATGLTDAKLPVAEDAKPESTEVKPAPKPLEKEVQLEKPESTMINNPSVQAPAETHPEATIEMPKEPDEAQVPEKSQEVKVTDEAQNKQQEVQVKAALEKHRQKKAKAKAEALKRQKAAEAKAAALKKQKLAKVKAEALKKQKAAQAKAEAEKKNKAQAQVKSVDTKKTARTEALKKQKEAQAKVEASSADIEIASTGISESASPTADAGRNHHAKLLGLLKKYKGKAIGINYDNSSEIKAAELVDANEEFFSVMVKDKKLQYSYPLKNILTIVEGQEGVETGEDDKKLKFDAVIKVFPLVPF